VRVLRLGLLHREHSRAHQPLVEHGGVVVGSWLEGLVVEHAVVGARERLPDDHGLAAPGRGAELVEPPERRGEPIGDTGLAAALGVAGFTEPEAHAGRVPIAHALHVFGPAIVLVEVNGVQEHLGTGPPRGHRTAPRLLRIEVPRSEERRVGEERTPRSAAEPEDGTTAGNYVLTAPA